MPAVRFVDEFDTDGMDIAFRIDNDCPSPACFQEIINEAYFEESETEQHVAQTKSNNSTSDHVHSYCATSVKEPMPERKNKKAGRKQRTVSYSFPVASEHSYTGLSTYVIGTSEAVDTAIAIGEDFKTWSGSDHSQVNDSNKLDNSTQLLLQTVLDRGNIEQACRDIVSADRMKSIIMHQLMESCGKRMSGLRKRKNDHTSFIMRKDVNEMKEFSWNAIFSEAYRVMPEVVQLLMACMLGKLSNGIRNVNELKKVIRKIGLIYCIVANNYDGQLSLLQRVIATVLHDSNCQRKVAVLHLFGLHLDLGCLFDLYCFVRKLFYFIMTECWSSSLCTMYWADLIFTLQ